MIVANFTSSTRSHTTTTMTSAMDGRYYEANSNCNRRRRISSRYPSTTMIGTRNTSAFASSSSSTAAAATVIVLKTSRRNTFTVTESVGCALLLRNAPTTNVGRHYDGRRRVGFTASDYISPSRLVSRWLTRPSKRGLLKNSWSILRSKLKKFKKEMIRRKPIRFNY